MKILASQIWIVLLSATTALAHTPGHGSPQGFEYCEYNADPVRTYRPKNIVDAEEALVAAEEALEKLEKDYEEADKCKLKCEGTVNKVLSITVGRDNIDDYTDYLAGGFDCYSVANSAVRRYNMYAQMYGWDVIKDVNQQRMIAGTSGAPSAPGTGRVTLPESGDLGSGGKGDEPGRIVLPDNPPPQNQDCRYTASNNTLDLAICDAARSSLSNREYSLCRSCLGPTNEYGRCLQQAARIEQELYEAQDLVEKREDELAEAIANPSSSKTCTDCMQDTRNWWERWGPMIAAGGIVGLSGYFAYKQERNSYEYYRDVIHENNNMLGYPTEPREDLSGYRLAAHLVNGTPIVISTGMSSGAFGCAGSSLYGTGNVLSGLFTGTQIGGAGGYPGGLMNGNVTSILNGGGIHGGGGQWGTGQPSSAQIDAMIRAQQESIAQQQRDLAALQQSASYYQSRSAIEMDALNRISALGPAPAVNTGSNSGVLVNRSSGAYNGNWFDPLRGDYWNTGQLSGGIQVRGQVNTYGNAGVSGVAPIQTAPSYNRSPGYNDYYRNDYPVNPVPPSRHQSGGSNVGRLPL